MPSGRRGAPTRNPQRVRLLPAAVALEAGGPRGRGGGGVGGHVFVRCHQRQSSNLSPPGTRPTGENSTPGNEDSAASSPHPAIWGSDGPAVPTLPPRRAPAPAPAQAPARPTQARGRPCPSPFARGAPAGAERPSEGAWPPDSTRARALGPYGYVSGHVMPTPKVPREATGR